MKKIFWLIAFIGISAFGQDYSVQLKKEQVEDYISTSTQTALNGKQATLVSGTNIKTVGGNSLLGGGNVTEVQNGTTASTTLAPSVTAMTNYVRDNAISLTQTGASTAQVASLDLNTITATSVFYVGTPTNAPAASDGFVMTVITGSAGYQTWYRQGTQDYFWHRRKTGGTWQAWEQIASRSWVNSVKQDILVSGTNIKTVGGTSILGSGNVTEVQNSLTASTVLAPSVTAVNTALALKADLASPTLIGDPKAPTPSAGDNDTSIATTAFIQNAFSAKILSGSAVLDFGSTSAGTSSELTLTVTGALPGDAVFIGVPSSANLSNSCYTAVVTTTDTVDIRFNNYSSSPIDPGSGTFTAKIIK